MENSGFLKSVSFGGFDKKDVLAYVDDLNTRIYTLEADLEEAKAQIGEDGGAISSSESTKKFEALLQKERAHVSELMAKNDTLTLTVQSHESVIADKDAEIENLKEKISDLENKVNSDTGSHDEASSFDIGSVFIEAKKSADKIIVEAKNAVKKMDADAKALAEQVVGEANQKAQSIVSNADAKANKILSEADVKTAEIKKASESIKATVLSDVENIFANVSKLNDTIAEFSKGSTTSLQNAKSIISDLQKGIKNDSIAVPTSEKAHAVPDKKTESTEKYTEPKSDVNKQGSFETPRGGKTPMSFDEMAQYAKSLQAQIEAEAVATEEM